MQTLSKFFSPYSSLLFILGIIGIIIGNNVFLLILIFLYVMYFVFKTISNNNVLGTIFYTLIIGFYIVAMFGLGLTILLGGAVLFIRTIILLFKN